MKTILIFVALFVAFAKAIPTVDVCEKIENVFLTVPDPEDSSDQPPCRCLPEEMGAMRTSRPFKEEGDGIWIGCTRQYMPSVFRALNALNETLISHLWIWNSVINIVPSDMFAKVRPRTLTLENSRVGVFRRGVFDNIGHRLKNLYLKNNILKSIEPNTFDSLTGLETLDLTGNKLTEIRARDIERLTFLETLMLSDNQINYIEPGAFKSLTGLKTLNLANNKLTNITKHTFQGLNNLEVLSIQGNALLTIDWDAFIHMKRLRTLDLGTNQLSRIVLRGLDNLQRLYINNNHIKSLQNVTLRDLPDLSVLSIDRNQISRINDNDLSALSQSSRLASLSFANNNISVIEGQAFEHVHELTVLSLQNNELSSLTSYLPSKTGEYTKAPFLKPLKKLRILNLSHNKITAIESDELNTLSNLKELILDNNMISKINPGAFNGLRVSKFFINNNRLYYLPDDLFESWSVEDLEAVDISDNPWECICGSEWIGPWLDSLGDRNVPSGDLGCLVIRCDNDPEEPEDARSFATTIIATCLAFAVFALLIGIGVLYVQQNCIHTVPIKRCPSDMVQLIPAMESLSYPNPFSAEKGIVNLGGPAAPSPKNKSGVAAGDALSKSEKRVRFGI
uniref:LRRCT domain-containing protein n=1 Tax=Panagrellus redivivus TaxID=6233 RepID=A0A7E4UXX0_PANRE